MTVSSKYLIDKSGIEKRLAEALTALGRACREESELDWAWLQIVHDNCTSVANMIHRSAIDRIRHKDD